MNVILADAGIPMVFIEFPAMLWALVPIIAVEAVVAKRTLGIEPWRSLKVIAVANVVSTVIGFPLLWLLLFGLQTALGGNFAYGVHSYWSRIYAVTVQAPWLVPYQGDMKWMILSASAYLLIPAFFASVFVERWICRVFWRDQENERLKRFSWSAHFASYAVLLVVASIYYGVILRRG